MDYALNLIPFAFILEVTSLIGTSRRAIFSQYDFPEILDLLNFNLIRYLWMWCMFLLSLLYERAATIFAFDLW